MVSGENALIKIRYAVDQLLFDEVDLSDPALEQWDAESRGGLYLLRAQLKLLISDLSMLEDCARARELMPRGAQYQSLYATLEISSPNCLLRFPTTREEFQKLLTAIDRMQPLLAAHTGPYGAYLCDQLKADILYYSGRCREALALAQLLTAYFRERGDTLRAMLAAYNFLRCQMALGDLKAARDTIFELIHWSSAGEAHREIYQVIRTWLNVTTGWSGDSPRYHVVPDGTVIAVLQDRAAAVQQGVCRLQANEASLGRLAEQWGTPGLSMRELYLRIYQVMVAYQGAAQPLSETGLPEVFRIVRDTGLIQTIIEYGKQIVPLLNSALKEKLFDPVWLAEMIDRASDYEESICSFREED